MKGVFQAGRNFLWPKFWWVCSAFTSLQQQQKIGYEIIHIINFCCCLSGITLSANMAGLMLHLDPPPRFLRLKLNPGDSICLPMFLFPKPYLPPKHLRFSHQSQLACYFPGGPVVRNLPFDAGDMGSISGGGTKTPHSMGQLNPCTTAT